MIELLLNFKKISKNFKKIINSLVSKIAYLII